MARRTARKRSASRRARRTSKVVARSVKRPTASRTQARKSPTRGATRTAKSRSAKAATSRSAAGKRRKVAKKAVSAKSGAGRQRPAHVAPARLARERRTLEEAVPTPPSSLNLDRHGSAVRTGRAEMAQNQANIANMTPAINAGDVDVNVEDSYFTGDESPGGDNPTPDQDIVDEIGRALGVEYQDSEELRASDKVAERDKHRWELDPASSEDYKNRK